MAQIALLVSPESVRLVRRKELEAHDLEASLHPCLGEILAGTRGQGRLHHRQFPQLRGWKRFGGRQRANLLGDGSRYRPR
jgi:hypothetical protein